MISPVRPSTIEEAGQDRVTESTRPETQGELGPCASRDDRQSATGRLACAVMRCRLPVLLAMHVVIFTTVLPMAFLMRYDGRVPAESWQDLWRFLPAIVLVKLAVFVFMGSHRGWWRYATFADVVRLAESTTLSTLLIVVAAYLGRVGLSTPRSVIVLDWAGTLLLLGGLRVSTRLLRERYYPMIVPSRKARPALVMGDSEASMTLVRVLQTQPGMALTVVGLLVRDPAQVGKTLGGVRVVGTPDDLDRLTADGQVDTILAPTPAVGPREIRTLVDAANRVGVRVQVVPGLAALFDGRISIQPRDVDIHDLLCREPVQIEDAAVGQFLRDRVVLVSGAAGSIGSEICRQVLRHQPARLVLLDFNENGLFFVERELRALAGPTELVPAIASITDALRVRTVFEQHRPAVVFHAAAHKHVPMMEANPGEAVKNNVFGTRVLVDQAVASGADTFVMISTDKAVHATSVMGACKRLAEMYVQARSAGSSTRLTTVRFGNVLGSAGSVVPIFREQIRRGGPVTVTHPEMTRYFMTIPEATQLVLQAGAQGRGGEIFVLDMGEPVRVLDLARDMVRLSGLTEGREIEIAFTGLRPGEKLYEELYDAGEKPLPTTHPKILSARHRPCEALEIEDQFARLARAVNQSPAEVVDALMAAVTDFRPNNRPAHAAPSVLTSPTLDEPAINGKTTNQAPASVSLLH